MKKIVLGAGLILLIVVWVAVYLRLYRPGVVKIPTELPEVLGPRVIRHYDPPVIQAADAYTVLFLGDSMTESLGVNFDELRRLLAEKYPDKQFGLFNYGQGGTSVLSLDNVLHEQTTYLGRSEPAVLERAFDVVIIESFGHNPLSEYSMAEGLRKQEEVLDVVVAELAYKKTGSLIVFLATIGASPDNYALGSRDLSVEVRRQWAEERNAYIENHIKYAEGHNIPLINMYRMTKGPDGEVDPVYVNPNDNIHLSFEGVTLSSQVIADYLVTVLPK